MSIDAEESKIKVGAEFLWRNTDKPAKITAVDQEFVTYQREDKTIARTYSFIFVNCVRDGRVRFVEK